MRARDVYMLTWCESFSSLIVRSSVYVDVKTEMCRVVLFNKRSFTSRCDIYFVSRPSYR